MKKTFEYILIFIATICFFIIYIYITSLIPSSSIKDNVKESSDVLCGESNMKQVYVLVKNTYMKFDNYSDALMINTAYSIDSTTPLYSAFVARKNYLPGITKSIEEDSVSELKSASKYKGHNEVGELSDVVIGNIEESFEYARYWHGYLTFLRPLLVLFNINSIRVILLIVYIILAILLMYLLYKKISWIISVVFLLGLISVEYFYMCFSLQGTSVFLIMMIFSIYVLIKWREDKNFYKEFFVVGMVTNFFDFLTVPILTFGIPIITYFLLEQKNRDISIKETIMIYMKNGILWTLGYGLTWASKWILTDIFFDKGLIKTALGQVAYRSVGNKTYNLLQIIVSNFKWVLVSFIQTLSITMIINIVIYKTNKNTIIEKMKSSMPYILNSFIPFVWYILLQNHSLNHSFFTYRDLLLSLIGIPITMLMLCNDKNVVLNKDEFEEKRK